MKHSMPRGVLTSFASNTTIRTKSADSCKPTGPGKVAEVTVGGLTHCVLGVLGAPPWQGYWHNQWVPAGQCPAHERHRPDAACSSAGAEHARWRAGSSGLGWMRTASPPWAWAEHCTPLWAPAPEGSTLHIPTADACSHHRQSCIGISGRDKSVAVW